MSVAEPGWRASASPGRFDRQTIKPTLRREAKSSSCWKSENSANDVCGLGKPAPDRFACHFTMQTIPIRPVRFSLEDAQKAVDQWGFNCGPGALCAILDLTPDEIRPKMADFEAKGYSNPTLVYQVLKNCGARWRQTYRSDEPLGMPIVRYGLMRIQWGGPWTKPGVPIRARYRQTHWVAVRDNSAEVFDVNAMCSGGWLKEAEWALQLMPWLRRECCPKGDGTWWPTHVLEVDP